MIKTFDILVSKLANQQIIRAIRRGLLHMMPLILTGSIVLVLLNLPIPAFQDLMLAIFGEGWRKIALAIHKGTLRILSLTALLTVSYALANEKKLVRSGEVNPISIVITALASFIAFAQTEDMVISVQAAGSTGMFRALVIAVLATNLFCFFYKCRDRIWPSHLVDYNGGFLIRSSFRVVIPALLTIFAFSAARMLLDAYGQSGGQIAFLQQLKEMGLTGESYILAVGIILMTHILWFFGVHGGNVIMDSFTSLTPVVSSGATGGILTKGFFDTFVYLGGAGATLGLLFALLLVRRRSNENRLAKVSLLPGIFNINEIMIYGLPIIFSPYYFVPFLFTPVILSLTAFVSITAGWAPPVTQAVEWTTPVFLSGYISTGSLAGVVLQGVNLALSIVCYIPFILLQNRHQQRSSIEVFKSLGGEIQYIREEQQKSFLNRHDETGALVRILAAELNDGFKNNSPMLHMEYQPKVNDKGEVMGAEALLRWVHPVYGYVSPLIILSICDEAGLMDKLEVWIMNQTFGDLQRWHEQGFTGLSLSVNMSPRQLQENECLVQTIRSCLDRSGVDPRYVELELTENAALDPSDATRSKLQQIKAMGLNLAIDDFGMGHSSLLYLCDFYANVVKIDASLVRTIASDKQRQQIVISILSLCGQLNVKVVAEGVETKEQVELLRELGCRYYQGFYFSKSLSYEGFIEYVKEYGWIQE